MLQLPRGGSAANVSNTALLVPFASAARLAHALTVPFQLGQLCCDSKLQVDRQSHVQRLGQRHERTGDSQLGRYLCAAQLAFRVRARKGLETLGCDTINCGTVVGGIEMPNKMLAPRILC